MQMCDKERKHGGSLWGRIITPKEEQLRRGYRGYHDVSSLLAVMQSNKINSDKEETPKNQPLKTGQS